MWFNVIVSEFLLPFVLAIQVFQSICLPRVFKIMWSLIASKLFRLFICDYVNIPIVELNKGNWNVFGKI